MLEALIKLQNTGLFGRQCRERMKCTHWEPWTDYNKLLGIDLRITLTLCMEITMQCQLLCTKECNGSFWRPIEGEKEMNLLGNWNWFV